MPGVQTPSGAYRADGFDVANAPATSNGAYSAGDIVGGLMTFALPNRDPVRIKSISVAVKAAVTSNLTLILFNASPTGTTTTDNAAYSLAVADLFKVRAVIPINVVGGFLYDHGTPNTYQVGNLDIVIQPDVTTNLKGNIYALLIDNTGWTLTSTSDIQVTLQGTC